MQRIQLAIVPAILAFLFIAYRWLGPQVPPARLRVLEIACALVVIVRIGSVIVIRRWRKPGSDLPGDWHANSVAGFWLVAAVVIAVLWTAMPYATDAQQLLAVLMAQVPVAVAAMGTVKRPTDGVRGWPSSYIPIVIPAGIIGYFVYYGGTYAVAIIVVMAINSALQLLLRNVLQAAVTRAWRSEAEAAAQRDARTRFLASASHDLGQSLHSARLFFDQVVRGTDPARRATAAHHAETAFDSVERQLDQMNTYMRLDVGQVVPKLAGVAVGPLLAGVAARAAIVSSPTGPVVSVVASRLRVRADPDLLDRALNNLAENAIRHAKATRLLIGARSHGRRVRLWVIDNGVGIAVADRAIVFDDYVRGSDHGDEQRGGFGLGLASVRRVAALMDGSVGIDPCWRRGAAFYIDLPAETILVG